jgi:hypothetical protein
MQSNRIHHPSGARFPSRSGRARCRTHPSSCQARAT